MADCITFYFFRLHHPLLNTLPPQRMQLGISFPDESSIAGDSRKLLKFKVVLQYLTYFLEGWSNFPQNARKHSNASTNAASHLNFSWNKQLWVLKNPILGQGRISIFDPLFGGLTSFSYKHFNCWTLSWIFIKLKIYVYLSLTVSPIEG